MKNLKTFLLLAFLQGFLPPHITAQIKIPENFYGLNLWFSNYADAPFGSNPPVTLGTPAWAAASASGARTMRQGGIAFTIRDVFNSQAAVFPHKILGTGQHTYVVPNPAGYVKIVDDCRAHGFEPMVTVPVCDRTDQAKLSFEEQAEHAAEVVRSVNITHNRKVKYWIIGNEPGPTQGYTSPSAGVARVSNYIKLFAAKMKHMDPTILIIGPDQDWADPDFFGPLFTGGSLDITGNISSSGPGNGLPYIDYVSFHGYSGFGSVWTSTSTYPLGEGMRARYVEDGYKFQSDFQNAYNNYIAPGSSRPVPLKGVCNEFNVQENPAITLSSGSSTLSADITSDDLNGNIFLAGQMNVDIMAGMLSVSDNDPTNPTCPYEFSNFWSVEESGQSLGFVETSGSTVVYKPTYWHYCLMANYFKGKFYANQAAATTSNTLSRAFKSYACIGQNYIGVIVMNQAATSATDAMQATASSKVFTINFNGVTGNCNASFNMGKWGSATYTVDVPNESTYMLFFRCDASTYATPALAYLGEYHIKMSDIIGGVNGAASYNSVPYYGSGIPTYAISGGTVCADGGGSSITLNAPSGRTVLGWYDITDLNTSLGTGSSISAGPGTYLCRLQGDCEEFTLQAVVEGVSPVISTAQRLGTVAGCENMNVNLTATVSAGSTCNWDPNVYLSTPTGSAVVASPPGSFTYNATATDGSGCWASDEVKVSLSPDKGLFIQDDSGDGGNEPNSTSTILWTSPAIWGTPNSTTAGPSAAATLTYDPASPSYIHIVVSNANPTLSLSGQVEIFWVKAGTAATWQQEWLNNLQGGVLFGDQIGVPVPVTVAGGGQEEIEVPWMLPNPADYTVDMEHFCVIARVIIGCPLNENTNVYHNTQWNGEVAWKNLIIVDGSQRPANPYGYPYNMRVQNTETISTIVRFELAGQVNANGDKFFDYGTAKMTLDAGLTAEWTSGGNMGTFITYLGGDDVRFDADAGDISNITMNPGEWFDVDVAFTFSAQPPAGTDFDVDLIQYNTSVTPEEIMGGHRFHIVVPACPTIAVPSGIITVCTGGCANLQVFNPNAGVTYDWTEYLTGTSVGSGTNVNVCPSSSTHYLVVAAANGCTVGTQVYVQVDPSPTCVRLMPNAVANVESEPEFFSVFPNPAYDFATINFDGNNFRRATFEIRDALGKLIALREAGFGENSLTLICSGWPNGLYLLNVYQDDMRVVSKKFIVMH